jgi:hypothetical protein
VRHLFPAAGAAFPFTASNASLVAATSGAALFLTAGSASLVTATAGAALFPAAAVLFAAASAGGAWLLLLQHGLQFTASARAVLRPYGTLTLQSVFLTTTPTQETVYIFID